MLQPTRTKYRKQQKGRNRGLAQRGSKVSFGEFGLKAVGRGRMTARQIESARRAMTRHVRRGGKVWIRVFPDKPITKKPLEVRQGKGKGAVEYWVAQIQPGRVLYEMGGCLGGDRKAGVCSGGGEAAVSNRDGQTGGTVAQATEIKERKQLK